MHDNNNNNARIDIDYITKFDNNLILKTAMLMHDNTNDVIAID